MSRAVRWSALALAIAFTLLGAGIGRAQAPTPPPLTARIFFKAGPAESGVFNVGQPVPIILQLENTSGASVATTQGFSLSEFFRRLYFTDPRGGIVTNKVEEKIHDYSRVFMCLSRGGTLQQAGISVVPLEVLAGPGGQGPFFVEFEIDASRFYDLSLPGSYTVKAQIPLLVFSLSQGGAVFNDCDQVPGQVANVGAVAGKTDFTIQSNTLAFTVQGTPPQAPTTIATVSPTPPAGGWLTQPALVSFTATSPSNVPIQRIVVQAAGAETNLTGAQGSITVTTDGDTVVAYHAEDSGGNIEATQTLTVRIDRTPPVITITVPAEGASFTTGQQVRAAFSCTDALSGIASCVGPVANDALIDTTPGPKTFTVNATDVAGNVATASVTYAVQGAAPGPDLVETFVSNPPATAVPGGRFSVTDTILNQGALVAAPSITRYYFALGTQRGAGDTLLDGTRSLSARNPGVSSTGTKTVTIPTNAPHGLFYLLACADDTGRVAETNEDNNCRASATQVRVGQPDLVMTGLTGAPAAVAPGARFAVTDTVTNQGSVAADASLTRYYLALGPQKTAQSIALSGTRSVAALGPGVSVQATTQVTVPASAALAEYHLLSCADDDGRVGESNETNNCAVAAARVSVGRPDLVVTALSNPPATAARGSSFGVTDTVTNVGALDAGTSTVRYHLSLDQTLNSGDRVLDGSRSVPALTAGSHSTASKPVNVRIPSNMPAGRYFLLGCADAVQRVTESVEGNNCRASTTTVVVP